MGIALVALVGGAFAFVQHRRSVADNQREAVRAFASAWVKGDRAAQYALLDADSRAKVSREAFERSYTQAYRAAGVTAVRTGPPGELEDGVARLPVTVRTMDFGTLRGSVTLRASDEDGEGRIAWDPSLRLPGLERGEDVTRRSGRRPQRANVLAADGTRLNRDPIGAGIAGVPARGAKPATGLERIYDERLGGRPSQTLRFGDRVIKRIRSRRGRSVRTTIALGLTRAAQAALGDRLGGVAVVRPKDGAVLALAGLAVSAPQAPGSTFKIVTLAAALQNGVTSPGASFPVSTAATLSGVRLRNAGDEPCGGSLTTSFAKSCNSVFGPLGAKLGRRRLVAAAERFGFNETPKIPAAKPSTVARDLKDDLAVGAAAIGQERDLATPLQMASVGATIANRGVRVRPRVVREEPIVRRRVVSPNVAAQVRDMMRAVVRPGGTGTSAAIPGVDVAGKTGTAELVSTADAAQNDANTNAWFVAFAPAGDPEVAVAVMLVGAGHGGTSAAPIARQVILAALETR